MNTRMASVKDGEERGQPAGEFIPEVARKGMRDAAEYGLKITGFVLRQANESA